MMTSMRRKYVYWISLVVVAISIKIFALFPAAVERYYSQGIYHVISGIQRFLFGWIPFSLGDLLYGSVVVYLIVVLVRFVRAIIRKQLSKFSLLATVGRLVKVCLWVYILFNILWGLNYNRLGIGEQLGLKPSPYSVMELQAVLNIAIEKLNTTADSSYQQRDLYYKKHFLFDKGKNAYSQAKNDLPFLKYSLPSVKPSIFSYLGDYLGYTGYYNPFTGEAQVNTTVPIFVQPFTCTHEIGHQLGYAKEMEANFAGYLAASKSNDVSMQYSVYFDIYIYAIRNLYYRDSAMAKSYAARLPVQAKHDVRELKEFFKKYENPFEPVIRKLYGQYLKANEQPQGILSYDEVLGWVIAYYRKFGKI
jgi:hypothetical protein